MTKKNFKIDMFVISPFHGIGVIQEYLEEEVMGQKMRMCKIFFQRDKITLEVPEEKLASSRIRHTISKKLVPEVFAILKEPSKSVRVIWSKKSQEYDKIIKSGDIFENARVVRDLYRNTTNPNRSYTERVIFETAFKNIVSEVSIVNGSNESQTESEMNKILNAYHETYSDNNSSFSDFENDTSYSEVVNA